MECHCNSAAPGRAYEKGQDRFKHVGKTEEPEIVFRGDDPKHKIGLCPRAIPDGLKAELLAEAIAEDNGDRKLDFPKRLYVVHDGAVYRAETTDWGRSYHAYPYSGKLGKALVERLAEMANDKGCRVRFDVWLDLHIDRHGK